MAEPVGKGCSPAPAILDDSLQVEPGTPETPLKLEDGLESLLADVLPIDSNVLPIDSECCGLCVALL